MKQLTDFINETKKTYTFKIRVAGELPENFDTRLENALGKYDVVNFSRGKTAPITERPLDFPQLTNCEVTSFDVEVNYPTSPNVLESYIQLEVNHPASHIIVRNENDSLELQQENKEDNKPYTSLLATEDMGGESAQQHVGQTRVMDLLKELETAKKERNVDYTPQAK